jgi:hypothetical protein
MKQSDSIVNLAKALAAVQGNVQPIGKDATNPHFRNKYASLDAIMEAVRPLLAANGLSLVQGGGAPISNVDGTVTADAVREAEGNAARGDGLGRARRRGAVVHGEGEVRRSDRGL